MVVPCCDETRCDPVVDVARAWIGTPYVHQASQKQVGTDCLGLIRGVWRALLGPEPDEVIAYSPGWSDASEGEALLDALDRHLIRVDQSEAKHGDVLVFRMMQRGPAKHAAVLTTGTAQGPDATIIHAYSGLSVCETRLTRAWQRRIAAAYRFPEQP